MFEWMIIDSISDQQDHDVIHFYSKSDPYYEFTNFFDCPLTIAGKVYPTSEHYYQAMKFDHISVPEFLAAISITEAITFVSKYARHADPNWTVHDSLTDFFGNCKLSNMVRMLPTPREAFNFARTYPKFVFHDWSNVKVNVMFIALREKFGPNHPQLQQLLLDTSNKTIVEHTINDSFWGDGAGNGKNMLGTLLMKRRAELRQSLNDRENFAGESSQIQSHVT
eukprot:TRINITY_DN206_c0_g1_i2.p1 TRINITY_DN206_c0_g1~~TRINITY_DN206_c0_g1_i2.p1  ORF type:complete len:223 (-),score=24.25 TRINITY_DN206_c0_g1_i2:221-889(-)